MSPVITAKDKSKRIFKSNFLEFFTKVHWSVPLFLYVPVIGFCFYRSLENPTVTWGVYFRAIFWGLLNWTFYEYLFHRFFFHYKPRTRIGKKIFYLVHEIHHEYPNDSLRLVMPPVMSLLLALLTYFITSYMLPPSYFYPFIIGFAIGYLCYDMIHYSVHHLPMKSRIGSYLKQHHLRHHFQEEDRGFGVSSPLWDWVFWTKFRRTSPGDR